jgi:DNA repair protein RecN (Recombination protein N)
MPNTDFKIEISTDENIMNESGMDSCEFFISTNRGETLRPLLKIASGGEISRIMLAIKMALQSRDFVSILIFDEIDSGISGSVAEQIGNTIENLSQSHQILCITHLSQIAGKGEHHYKVKKNRINHRNVAEIKKLSTAERVLEVAALISGKEITKASRKQAQTLLEHG